MTIHDFCILNAINIASTIHRHPKRGFEATAAQIAEVLREDERFWYCPLRTPTANGRWLAFRLGRLRQGHPTRREPLVERVGRTRWRLTEAGVRVLNA